MIGLDWIVQCFTSPPTRYRLYGRRFLQVKRPNQQYQSTDWLSMVLRLRQHNIGYTADGFYRSDDPTNSVKALKEGG